MSHTKVHRPSAQQSDEVSKQIHTNFSRMLILLAEDRHRMNWSLDASLQCKKELRFSDNDTGKKLPVKRSKVILDLERLRIDFEIATEA